MALSVAFPGPSGLVDSTQLRKDLAGLIVRDTAGNPRAGVFPRHTNALVTSRASMGVDVAAFEAAIVRGGGPLFIQNDGTVTVTIGAAPASNSRIDVVYVKQNESAAPYSDANNTATLGVVAGTAAASPTAPAVPTGALALAQVLIPSTATTTQSAGVTVTQVFSYTTTSGGTVLFRNTSERDSFATTDGQGGYLLSTGQALEYVASATTPGWFVVGGKPDVVSVTPNALYAHRTDTQPLQVSRINGRIHLEGSVTNPGAINNYGAGASNPLGNIPVGYRPAKIVYGTTRFFAGSYSVLADLAITPAGDIVFVLPSSVTGITAGSLTIAPIVPTWPDARL